MTYANLGPPLSANQIDLPPFAIHSWSAIPGLSNGREITFSFKGRARCYDIDVALIVVTTYENKEAKIIRCAMIYPDGRAEQANLGLVPGIVSDLARSKTREFLASS